MRIRVVGSLCLGVLLGVTPCFGQTDNPCPPIFAPHETILFQGDSITDMNRGRTADPNHILGHSYVFSIATRYGDSYASWGLNFVNRGVSGNTMDDLAARWDTDTLAIKPDVLSILIGVNDVYFAINNHQDFSADKVEASYDKLLAQTVAAQPKVKLILGEPFILDIGMVAKDPDRWHKAVDALDAAVNRLGAKYHAPVVHLQQTFLDATKRAPTDHWIWDGIHPTYSGQHLLADAWIKAYNDFYVSPLLDTERNSAIAPVVNFERDSYDWLHRHDDVLDSQVKIDPEVVMIGDSITHFWGGEPNANHSNGPDSWKLTFGKTRVLNMGFGWDRTQNVLWRLIHGELDGVSPKTIVLNIGTNNLVGDNTARTNTPAEVAVGIESIVDLLHRRAPKSRIVVMGVFPRGFENGNALDLSIRELNSILSRDLQRRDATFLDIGAKVRHADGSIDKETFFDGTHPTDRGYATWGQALREAGVVGG